MSRLGNTNIRFRIYLAARLRYIDPLKGVRDQVNNWCKYIHLLLAALIHRPIYDLNQNICSCIFQDCLAVEVKSQNECRVEISFNYCPVTISVSGSVMVTVVAKRYWWWGQWGQWPTLTFLHNIDNIQSPGRYRAARCGRTARTWSCLTAPGDGECLDEAGLLVLTGRPVNRPAGRPAKTIVLAGQKWPKLNIWRNMHDFGWF